MARSILRPMMYFFNSMISTPKKVWLHLSQWFQRGLIVKVYRGQRMPSCSNTSHDHYYLHQSCVPDLCRTTRWLSFFFGGVQLYRSVEKLDLISNSILCGLLGVCSLNLYTQLYVCKYQELKHLYCSIHYG